MVKDTAKETYTEDVFGPCLHSYTIRDAIRDQNVLGFKVDFETTIDQEAMKEKYLPEFYHAQHPDWSNEKIKEKIQNIISYTHKTVVFFNTICYTTMAKREEAKSLAKRCDAVVVPCPIISCSSPGNRRFPLPVTQLM